MAPSRRLACDIATLGKETVSILARRERRRNVSAIAKAKRWWHSDCRIRGDWILCLEETSR
jgi:hypothetical protein